MTYLAHALFPIDISRGATGGPAWASSILVTGGGQRYTNQANNQPIRRYDVSHAARHHLKFERLLAHFHVTRGPLHSFPFRDWSDYKVTTGQGVFAVLDTTTSGQRFQMYRRYTFGAEDSSGFPDFNRKINKPQEGTIEITGGTVDSIDYETGIVTMVTGTPTDWTGQFYIPCNYDLEGFGGEIIDGTPDARIMGWSGIKITENRNP
jgi:uncharacterized protein (TIGR02217 family)